MSSIKTNLAIGIGRLSYRLLRLFGKGGTSFPGKIALKIDSNLLNAFQDSFETIIVTGTNGKTLTTALITKVLQSKYKQVITNTSGSNMIQGIAGTLLTQKKINSDEKTLAVLEVDEANVKTIAQSLQPSLFVLTNIFRDQLDRYGEIYTVYDLITDGIKTSPNAIVLANGDSPIFARKNYSNQQVFFGFDLPNEHINQPAPHNTDGILSPTDNSILNYHYITYANQGDYYSTTDNFKRPSLTFQVTKINELQPTFSQVEIDHLPFRIPVGGLYNVYNALAAYAVGRQFNIGAKEIQTIFNQDTKIFGRQESFQVDKKQVTIVLIKNPVGTNSVIDMMSTEQQAFSLIVLLNANYADGIDTSWIWDANFEKLHQTKLTDVYVGGERFRDIQTRLKMANFQTNKTINDLEKILETIAQTKSGHVYIAATYTAMLQVRKVLSERKVVGESF